MTETNEKVSNEFNDDGLKVNYDDDTGQVSLEWDPQDPTWNWLSELTEDEIRDIIMKHAQQILDEIGNETENT